MSRVNRLLIVSVLSVVCAVQTAQAQTATVLEFFNGTLGHYFISQGAGEITSVDTGQAGKGWWRTAGAFSAYADGSALPANVKPVCRFYARGPNSHFYTADAAECEGLRNLERGAAQPFLGWAYEGVAFYVQVPQGGICPSATQPIFRSYNQRAGFNDSNHRFTSSAAAHAQMIAQGWADEGIAFCVSAATPAQDAIDFAKPVTDTSPFADGCEQNAPGLFSPGAEVEPSVAVSPLNPAVIVGAWQQDRYGDGGSRGVMVGLSEDGGRTWMRKSIPFSRCTGGTVANGGDYARATDPWVSFGPDGTVHVMALGFSGGILAAGGANAMLASRSTDGGRTWSAPQALIRDGESGFNDKNAITADPTDARYVYAGWDRLTDRQTRGPAWLARSVDGGASWEPARIAYDPGVNRQTIDVQIVVQSNGTLVMFFVEQNTTGTVTIASLRTIRSGDKGVTWDAPITLTQSRAVGTRDPIRNVRVRDGAITPSIAVGPDGTLAVAWQDARLSGGVIDGVLFAQSADAGRTWTAPVQINPEGQGAAFIPTVHIRRDGVIGVHYYDFRAGGATESDLPTQAWLATSRDGRNFNESRVLGPFNMQRAPNANGLFVGDYHGLSSAGTDQFVTLFGAVTPTAADANRTDIYFARSRFSAPPAATGVAKHAMTPVLTPEAEAIWQARTSEAIREANLARMTRRQ
jgi:hypothetical protein